MIRVATLLLLACAACGCEVEMAAPAPRTIVEAQGAQDELYLPASSTAGVATRPLLPGVTYRVIIEGTLSLWRPEHWSSVCAGTPWPAPQIPSRGAWGPVGVDAEWTWAWPTSSSLCQQDGPVPRAQRRVLIQTTSTAPAEPLPAPAETSMSPNHVYTYTITGSGAPAVFRFRDAPSGDNYGQLRILIFPS